MHVARRCELQTVIHASKVVVLETSKRERREAMAASILKRDEAAVILAVNHDLLVEHRDRFQLVAS